LRPVHHGCIGWLFKRCEEVNQVLDRRQERLGPEADAQDNVIMHSEDCRNFETLEHRTISKERQR